jgi:hypothetical protein
MQSFQKNEAGVRPPYDRALNPRQRKFMELYLDTQSVTFGNCYKSALAAGFSDQTARNLTHNKPGWYSETLGQQQGAQPEHLLLKLTEIMSNPTEPTQNKLKAIDMLMKFNGMYKLAQHNTVNFNKINIQTVLD